MELLANLRLGLSVAITPTNLFFCFVGVLVGTLIGVLPRSEERRVGKEC